MRGCRTAVLLSAPGMCARILYLAARKSRSTHPISDCMLTLFNKVSETLRSDHG